jgi:hypothetical protein
MRPENPAYSLTLTEFRVRNECPGRSPRGKAGWSQRLSEPSDQRERAVAAGERIWRWQNAAVQLTAFPKVIQDKVSILAARRSLSRGTRVEAVAVPLAGRVAASESRDC